MTSKKTDEWSSQLEDFFEFSEWVLQFLDPFEKGCVRDAHIIDDFGGELFVAYRSASSSSENLERLFDRFFREEEREVVEPLLINVFDNLRQALHDLTLELLYPAYEAVGRKYHAWRNDHMGTIVSEETLENGILVRKPFKGKRSLFGSKKDRFRFQLERVLRVAASHIYPDAITVERLVVIINKRFTRQKGKVDPQPGSWIRGPYIETHRPLTKTSLEKLFRDYGINWREEKKRIKTKLQEERNPTKKRIPRRFVGKDLKDSTF